jgi:hypothetical protein
VRAATSCQPEDLAPPFRAQRLQSDHVSIATKGVP